MAPFTNPLRHLWGRGQIPTTSTPDSIAYFDGISDDQTHSQQMHRSASQQQPNGRVTIGNGFGPAAVEHYQDARDENAYQAAGRQQYEQPSHQLVVCRNELGQNPMHSLDRLMHELGDGEQDRYDNNTRQQSSRAATARPPETSSQHHANSHLQPFQFSSTATTASAKIQVKQEPAPEGHNDHDVFAEFTNEEFHNDDSQTCAKTQQSFNNTQESTGRTHPMVPSIKQEPHTEGQLPINATERAGTVNSIVTAGNSVAEAPAVMLGPTRSSSAVGSPQSAAETGVSTSEVQHSQAQDLHGTTGQVVFPASDLPTTAVTDRSASVYSFEQYAKDPQQLVVSPRAQRSASTDSVIGSRRHSFEETALSLGEMDLLANSRLLAQQWQQRQKLFGTDMLTTEAVHANPSLLHGPLSVQQPGQTNHRPQTRTANEPQRSSHFPYSMDMQYSISPVGAQLGQVPPCWMPPGYGPNQLMQHALLPGYPPPRSINPQHMIEVQEEKGSEASDDDEPLVTRAPRHASTTASPAAYTEAHQSANPRTNAKPCETASKRGVSGVKEASITELAADDDDDDEETTEPISWKLPDFEATYHPPATERDPAIAKISTRGSPQNLVREEVVLSAEHTQQEMQLFLSVFLPGQQALATADPAPAHAVLNFHTISVMVLESFEQWEIGDEPGRAHTGDQPPPPSPRRAADAQLPRTRSARDADVDEIFFAVVDRWRAGLIAGKQPLRLIRGCQEFCDVALDVIHYVKEHGLLVPEARKRKERSDKGVARGPRGPRDERASRDERGEANPKPATKRKADAVEAAKPATSTQVNQLQGRKKAKVEDQKPKAGSKTKTKSNTKTKSKAAGVTVVDSRKK